MYLCHGRFSLEVSVAVTMFPDLVVARRAMLITSFGNVHRVRLATAWMNEEWYNDRMRSSSDPNWVCTLHRLRFARETDTDLICGDVDFYSDLIMISGLIRS